MVAARLGFAYLDTGAMYRAVGLRAERLGVAPEDESKMGPLLDGLELELRPGDGDTKVLLFGEDVSLAIRTPEMGMMASRVSAQKEVRLRLTRMQQEMAARGSVVAEGRDTGTVVFPEAQHKFYLDASPEERSRRRTLQLQEKGMEADYEEILAQIIKRDRDDSSRTIAPLRAADDAVVIDSSNMSISEVVEFIVQEVEG